ncbi:LOW QUALITY PROTEIN: inactive serine protease PAMR1 [Labeo rohita]|uniref:LOW QUALITY PROTEIN: inactive serine protease PAMR1 n=1 Tax=Labeo rohita TaxID=84645 RepID=UPI0021E1D9D1|nr:LOW QUALITY PROTEIN: inactive serine protease PAMR1 [Labeo rohita]
MCLSVELKGRSQRACHILFSNHISVPCITLFIIFLLSAQGTAWPYDYRFLYNYCPGPEWSVMCRGCCEYDVIHCKCPLQGSPVGYAVPCCRNAVNECDPCIIHPGCSIFENCKRCNNGTWGPRDDFFVKGQYCTECRPGWSGGDCLTCGGVIHKRQGHLVLESYPNNARCEWTLKVDRPFTIDLRFMMLSLEFDHSCQYDYVEVRDGESLNSRVIGRYCGNERPPSIKSTGSSLHILFISDGYKNFDGFFAIFQESSECISSPCLHDGTCIVDSSHSFHCACLAGYTGRRCEHVLECRTPLIPAHGTTEHLDVRVGGHAVFQCDPGYTLKGFRMATCLLDGSWSAPTPQCVPDQNCGIPPKPEHGDHFLVYGPNDVLIAIQYFCYKLYKLNGTPQRTCLDNNTWSGTAPTCVKELIVIPAADNEQSKGKHKPTGQDEMGHAKNKTSQEKENESKTDKDIKPQKPTAGKDNMGQDVKFGEDMGIDIGSNFVKEKTKIENKDADSNINTIRKNEAVEDKDTLQLLDKDAHLDIGTKVGSPTKDLGMEFVEIVLIDNKMVSNQTTKDDKTRDGGIDKGQKRTDGPQYTILSLTEDEKENILYEIDTIHRGNNTTFFNKNDIEENLTLLQETEQPKTATTGNNSTAVIPTVSKTTDKMTMTVKPTEKVQVDTVNEKMTEQDLQETKKDEGETGQIIGNQGEGRPCLRPSPLYNGYYMLVPGLLPETVEFFCNQSYALSGSAQRTCQPNGTWSGTQPICIRACREPKVSVLVKQRVLPPHMPSRKTPVHKFYSSSGVTNFLREVQPTQTPFTQPLLPQGFHHIYTHIEYECMSPFYQHFGSARRTCLKMGKWSGRHVSCSPVCGKLTNFDPQNPSETNWPWLAAIYRLPVASKLGKLSVAKTMGANTELMEEESNMDGWQLVCSGALVNQRSVVVAAHCVTELGKLYPLDTAKIRVVLGKQYRSDLRVTKGLQRLRVSSITLHPNYDPLVLDSDVAILKLLDKARIGENVLPICLPDAHDTVEPSRQRMVTGWSLLSDQKAGNFEKARVGRVILGDIVHCEQQYANYGVPISVSENMMCGRQGSGAEQSNICPADTGGILILPPVSSGSSLTPPHGQDSQAWKLLGLVSFGYDSLNCNPELYTVYTHVANFVNFIEENMT